MSMLSRIQMPARAKRGEVIEIRIAIQHPMETGYRHDDLGKAIPANVVNRLLVQYDGNEIFRAEMGTGIAANPYLAFYTVAGSTGNVEFSWGDDKGETGSASALLTVEP
jgi:sulfur-oxidizing protein SoxZ